jgi:putative sterol carrier protein
MSWQAGKKAAETPGPQFARLRPLAETHQNEPDKTIESLANALKTYERPVRIHIRLTDGEKFDHWEVETGKGSSKARRHTPKDADVHLVLRHETWEQIARGDLAPFDALVAGKMRVGGDLELAKSITRHLSDPAVPFVPPCGE